MSRIFGLFLAFVFQLSFTGLVCAQGKVLGVGVHLSNASREEAIRQLDLAASLGVSGIRMDAPWKFVENDYGVLRIPPVWDEVVEAARLRGIRCLFILDYGHPKYQDGAKPVSAAHVAAFARYAEHLATHFKGKVETYEIWNEWDLEVGGSPPGRASDYVALVRAVSSRLKSVDVGVTILAGAASGVSYGKDFLYRLPSLDFGSSTFFSDMLSQNLLDYVDGLSVHIYVYWFKGVARTSEGALTVLDGIRDKVSQYRPMSYFPIHVTEVGWTSTYKGSRIFSTLEEQAHYLADFADKALALDGVQSVYLYELIDGNSRVGDIEGNFGVVDIHGDMKAAFQRVRAVSDKFR